MENSETYKIKTLVVEDEKKILNYICNKIVQLDDAFEIIDTAYNGQEAMDKIVKHRPHVVFTDISMPVMGGMELIKKIRHINPHTIIVIISGYSEFSYAQQAMRYGITNYLLKPLEHNLLAEALFDIKKSLSYVSSRHRHITYSEPYGLIPKKDEVLTVVLICIGNVICNMQDDGLNEFYLKQFCQISWSGIMNRLYGGYEWFASDGNAVNQKVISIKSKRNSPIDPSRAAADLQKAVQEETDLVVNVACVKQNIGQEELQNYVKRLRNVIRKRLVISESHIFYLEEEEQQKNDMIEMIKMKLNAYIKQYFISADLDKFLDEIRMMFKYMKNNHAPQENIEKICVYVLKLLEFSNQGYEREWLDELQNHMLKDISMISSEERLYESLIETLSMVNRIGNESGKEDDIETIIGYINEHYLTIESMEEVADVFGYNYTYFSRMFKKKAGESLSRYILKKKIELAKEMLSTQQELKITEVSDLCGYNDYRYFSRVFRNEVGISPSEYKEHSHMFPR